MFNNKEFQVEYLKKLIAQNFLCGIILPEMEYNIVEIEGGYLIEQVRK